MLIDLELKFLTIGKTFKAKEIMCVFIKPSETFIHDHSQLGAGLKRIVLSE